MPKHVDRGGSGGIFERDAVLLALNIPRTGSQSEDRPSQWSGRDDDVRRALARPRASEPADPWDFETGALNKRLEETRNANRRTAGLGPLPSRSQLFTARPPDDLGDYVVVKQRKDDRYAVYFAPPARLRPKGWRATIRLPMDEPPIGATTDEVWAQMRAEAEKLLESMKREWFAQRRQLARASMSKPGSPT